MIYIIIALCLILGAFVASWLYEQGPPFQGHSRATGHPGLPGGQQAKIWGCRHQDGRLCDPAEGIAPFCALVPNPAKWVQ